MPAGGRGLLAAAGSRLAHSAGGGSSSRGSRGSGPEEEGKRENHGVPASLPEVPPRWRPAPGSHQLSLNSINDPEAWGLTSSGVPQDHQERGTADGYYWLGSSLRCVPGVGFQLCFVVGDGAPVCSDVSCGVWTINSAHRGSYASTLMPAALGAAYAATPRSLALPWSAPRRSARPQPEHPRCAHGMAHFSPLSSWHVGQQAGIEARPPLLLLHLVTAIGTNPPAVGLPYRRGAPGGAAQGGVPQQHGGARAALQFQKQHDGPSPAPARPLVMGPDPYTCCALAHRRRSARLRTKQRDACL